MIFCANAVILATMMLLSTVFSLAVLIHSVSGLSTISPQRQPAKSTVVLERRAFVSTSITTLPLIGLNSIAYADNTEGYIDGPRGLKYKVTKPPTDPDSTSPQRAQKVKAKYTLYLNGFPDDTPNSKKVDSSKLAPFGFVAGVSQVIKGWDLTVLDMKKGEARRIIVPSSLGYGDRGAGGAIPGGATLYFDIELADIGEMSKLGPEQLKWLEDNPL